ncbi:MAG TPA: hypothetical protein VNH11_34240 [Pirellulales bacterium]|nr:hypothetical protein [Pirellulales bacterium]
MSTYHQPVNIDAPLFLSAPHCDVRSFASAKGIEAELETMLSGTREIFGDSFRVVLEEDAGIENDVHLVFEVKTSGEVDDVLLREDRWHDRCVTLAPKAAPLLRLFVDIQ